MRLIRNTNATDSIIAYDARVRDIIIEETGVSLYYEQLNDLTNKMASYQKIVSAFKIRTPLELEQQKINFRIKQETGQFEHLYNLIYKYRETVTSFNKLLGWLKTRGTRLIDFLQTEYNMK